jgi:hypothetical protein
VTSKRQDNVDRRPCATCGHALTVHGVRGSGLFPGCCPRSAHGLRIRPIRTEAIVAGRLRRKLRRVADQPLVTSIRSREWGVIVGNLCRT